MTTDREYLACLLCTAQGVPMVTRIFRGETARTIGYWKSVSQYICLSAGLWKSTANWHSFLISNDSTTLYVISFVWCGHIIFCCIDMVTEHESVAQPFLVCDNDKFVFLLPLHLIIPFIIELTQLLVGSLYHSSLL